jgi:hypothetical protein
MARAGLATSYYCNILGDGQPGRMARDMGPTARWFFVIRHLRIHHI